MKSHFPKVLYGQRWQAETIISMLKRNFGSALRARYYHSQNREIRLRILTHDLGILLRPSRHAMSHQVTVCSIQSRCVPGFPLALREMGQRLLHSAALSADGRKGQREKQAGGLAFPIDDLRLMIDHLVGRLQRASLIGVPRRSSFGGAQDGVCG
jgi:hypothetical protein